MIKIFGIAVISSVVYLYVRKYNPEYAIVAELAGAGAVIMLVIPYIRDAIDFFYYSSSYSGIDKSYVSVVIKTAGIAFVTQFSGDICRDAGQNAVASGIELAGKLMLCVIAVPVAKALLETALKMIGA